MRYTMTEPCDACPFLKGSGFTFMSLAAHASGEFACHKTCTLDEESDEYKPHENSPHCAGALIFNEKRSMPHQMMRICERIGLYDARKLNYESNVSGKPCDYRKGNR